MEPVNETIGQRLRRLRHERGLSQRELSSPGVSYAYISRIEADRRNPSVKALRKLAAKLDVTPEYLETGEQSFEFGVLMTHVLLNQVRLVLPPLIEPGSLYVASEDGRLELVQQ